MAIMYSQSLTRTHGLGYSISAWMASSSLALAPCSRKARAFMTRSGAGSAQGSLLARYRTMAWRVAGACSVFLTPGYFSWTPALASDSLAARYWRTSMGISSINFLGFSIAAPPRTTKPSKQTIRTGRAARPGMSERPHVARAANRGNLRRPDDSGAGPPQRGEPAPRGHSG